MIRKLVAIGLMATTAFATPAFATEFVGNYSISAYTSGGNNGLLVNTTKTQSGLDFTLNNVGDSKHYNSLFKISTPETTVNADDLNGQAITVTFDFTSPLFSGSVNGTTVGERSVLGIFQNGLLTWNDGGVETFNFGNGGLLTVSLDNNIEFGNGLFGLSSLSKTVGGTFTLTQAAAVPEPATWAMMIGGFGLTGAAMRRRRRIATAFA